MTTETPDWPGKTIFKRVSLLIILVFLILFLTVSIHYVLRGNTIGIDFFVYWTAGEAFFFGDHNPYAESVTHQIQMGVYPSGSALPGEDPMHFAYPPYAILPIFPLLFFSFDWAQAIWLAFNLIILLIIVYLAFPKTPKWVILLLPFYYQTSFGLLLGNFAVLIFAILVFILGKLVSDEKIHTGQQILIGFLLAWTTAKPQFVWLYVLFIIILSYRRRYKALLASFCISLSGMVLLTLLVSVNWPQQWFHQLAEYAGSDRAEASRTVLMRILLPENAIPIATGISLLMALFMIVYLFSKWRRNRVSTLILLAWYGFFTYFFHPSSLSYEQLILVLPVFFWASQQNRKSKSLLVVWIGGFVLSYVFLFMSISGLSPWAVAHLPFLVYMVWLGWLSIKSDKV